MANNTKQQAINTFTGGLNTDLHPLTTPNDILTDCINGTVITYNGNEYILQNDMGNYKLDKAKLYADYIPIGIKEYGNIIYIVSYNPIDKKCQIGSYPSPQTLFDNSEYGSKNENYQGVPTYTLDLNWTWPTNTKWLLSDGIVNIGSTKEDPTGDYNKDVLFTNTKPNQNLRVFFPADGLDLKDTFLNPGDKYYLKKEEGEDSHWKFQRCEYYTLTESKEALPIEEGLVISDPNDYAPEKLRNVTWETPGWLAYKPSLIEPASFDLYLTDIKIPSFLTSTSTRQTGEGTGELSFNVQGQLTINTTGDWKDYYDNLKVYFDYSYAGGSWENDWDNGSHVNSEEEGIPTNYGNTIDILTFNNKKSLDISKEDIENNKTVVIRATPYIIDDIYGIVYDNLAVTYTINLGELYSINEIETFSVYKYLSDDEGVTINFSIISPTSNLGQITCKYRIHSIADNFTAIDASTEYKDIDSLNLLGQNILTLEWEKEAPWFKKEEIYIFEVSFFNSLEWEQFVNSEKLPRPISIYQTAEFLIGSSIMNDFYTSENRFQDITLDKWTANIKKYAQVEKNIKISDTDNTNNSVFKGFTRVVRTISPEVILKPEFYTSEVEDTNWIIKESGSIIENPSKVPEHSNVETIANTITEKENILESSSYFGVTAAYYGNLLAQITAPKIFTNEGLWEDVLWNNSTTTETSTIVNGTTLSNSSSKVYDDLSTKTPRTNSEASVCNAKGWFEMYNSSNKPRYTYKRWYLYKNASLFPEFFSASNNASWTLKNITKFISSFKNNLLDELSESEKNVYISYLTKLSTKSKSALISRKVPIYNFFSSKDIYGKVRYAYKNSQFKWNDLTYTGDGDSSDTGEVFQGDRDCADALSNWFKDHNNDNQIFIPTFFEISVNRSGKNDGNGNREPELIFPDTGRIHDNRTGLCWNGSNRSIAISIPCRDGQNLTYAIVRFYGSDKSTGNGVFYGSYAHSATQVLNGTQGAYNTDCSTNALTSTLAAIFSMAIHLYGVYDRVSEPKYLISDSGSSVLYESSKTYTLIYKRKDTLKSIKYKKINLYDDEEVSKINWEALKNSFKEAPILKLTHSNIYEKNKLASDIALTTTSNKIPYTFSDTYSIADFGIVFTQFISALNNQLSGISKEWEDSLSKETNKVYSDLNDPINTSVWKKIDLSTETIQFFNELTSSLLFEYKNGKGYIYYNGFPEIQIGLHPHSGFRSDFYMGRVTSFEKFPWTNITKLLYFSKNFEDEVK